MAKQNYQGKTNQSEKYKSTPNKEEKISMEQYRATLESRLDGALNARSRSLKNLLEGVIVSASPFAVAATGTFLWMNYSPCAPTSFAYDLVATVGALATSATAAYGLLLNAIGGENSPVNIMEELSYQKKSIKALRRQIKQTEGKKGCVNYTVAN